MPVTFLSTYIPKDPFTITDYNSGTSVTNDGMNATFPLVSYWQTVDLVGETPHILLVYKDNGSTVSFRVQSWWMDQTWGGNCQGCDAKLYINGNFEGTVSGTNQTCSGDFGGRTFAKSNMSIRIEASYSHCDINNNTTIWSISETLGPINLSFDSIAPTITGPTYSSSDVTVAGSNIYCKNSTLTVSYTASDSGGSGLAGIWIDGVQASSTGSASKTYTVAGDFTSTAYAKDNAGNQSGSVSQLFKFDNIAPTGTLAIDSSQTTNVVDGITYINTSDVKLSITKSDSESGLF